MSQIKKELIAPCGMNCAICACHLAMKHDAHKKGVKIPKLAEEKMEM